MAYKIIYSNIAGCFTPKVSSKIDVEMDTVIGTIHPGRTHLPNAKPVAQYANCRGRIISVFTYADNNRFVGPQFPLCLVWDGMVRPGVMNFADFDCLTIDKNQPAFAMTAGDTERVKSGNGKKKAAPEKNSSTKVKRSGREKTASGKKAAAGKETAAASKSSAKAKGSSKLKRASAKSKKNKKSIKVR